MWNMNEVIRIEYRGNYVYHVVFDDGMSGDVDFEPLLARGPIFEPLRDLMFFQRACIDGGTMAWPNGADVSPESLYEKAASAQDHHEGRLSATSGNG